MIQRVFIPGSEWLYFKLYSGYKSADTLLCRYLWPLLQGIQEQRLTDKFFFIRYADPDPHIRLRLHVGDPKHYSKIFAIIYRELSPAINNGLVIKLMCDTYCRELERYGESAMELTETLFSIDSRYVLALLVKLYENGNSEQLRWMLSLRLLEGLLVAAGYGLDEKCTLLNRVSSAFRSEFGCHVQPYSKQLNDKYRSSRLLVAQALSSDGFPPFDRLFREREAAFGAVFRQMSSLSLEVPLRQLMGSYLHMTMNRWFRSKNRVYEMVIYHMLDKHYSSEKARLSFSSVAR